MGLLRSAQQPACLEVRLEGCGYLKHRVMKTNSVPPKCDTKAERQEDVVLYGLKVRMGLKIRKKRLVTFVLQNTSIMGMSR